MYAKIFSSLFSGSMRGKSNMILVFVNMLTACDKEGYDDRHPQVIADETGLPLAVVKDAITGLSDPDPESRTLENEGRRIRLIDESRSWGWEIINKSKYDKLVNEENRRETFRKSTAKRRASVDTSTPVNICLQESTPSTHIDVDVEVEEDKDKKDIDGEPQPKSKTFKQWNAAEFEIAVSGLARDRLSDSEKQAFIDYWTEPSASGKMRFQSEKFFDIGRRIGTWNKNNFGSKPTNSGGKFNRNQPDDDGPTPEQIEVRAKSAKALEVMRGLFKSEQSETDQETEAET